MYVWNQNGERSESQPSFWTTGFFKNLDWKAKWIGLDKGVGDDKTEGRFRELSARMLRHEFEINKKVKSATVFISGLGLFELYLNGDKIGDQVLSPALTEYNKRTYYITFDVTKNLKSSKNAIGVILGNGRYFAPRGIEPKQTRTYGFPKLICQLEIIFEDGTTKRIVTNETWKLTTNGPIRKNNEFDGEYYDARLEFDNWFEPNFDDSKWMNAQLVEKPGEKFEAQPNESIKIVEVLNPISIKEHEPGVFIFDMGQNMVGWVEVFVKGNRGDTITLKFAEKLKDDGKLSLANLRSAKVTDTYILKGDGEESWEPKFTYHGFRFVEMKGYPGVPTLSSIKGKVIHDNLDLTGSFSSSNSLINNIYKNAFWSIRGNYRSIPTDCPQRDERQAWLGDRSVGSIGESFIFNVSNFYNKWLNDIKDAQLKSGSLPNIAPTYWPRYSDNTTWPGTYLFISEMLYNQYGDVRTIQTHYPNMQKWIKHMSHYLVNGIMPKDKYGDWCVPPEDINLIFSKDPNRKTSAEYLGTAYFYYELKLMEKFATILNKGDDANSYSLLAEKIKIAFNNKFFDTKKIMYSNNTITVNILALSFNLVPGEHNNQIVTNLTQKILNENNSHIGNGLIGGQWLMRTLTKNGYGDLAYTLASQKTYPSWGYMIEQGATTIWELWNGDYAKDWMNSGNHVMLLGDLIIWFYEDLAGIKTDPNTPAFKHIIMKPNIVGDLTNVTASYNSIYGEIKSAWKIKNEKFIWNVSIPPNTSATVYIPTRKNEIIMEGKKIVKDAKGIRFIREDGDRKIFKIVSGEYFFTSNWKKRD